MRILIEDGLKPEANSMLQALYSRSASSIIDHLSNVEDRGFEKFMEKYYVEYGHESIGDCGFTTIFIEEVSILTCKALQNTPLYFGQETSTRYINFSNNGYTDPVGTTKSKAIICEWIEIYTKVHSAILSKLTLAYPCPDGIKAEIWAKTLEARAFDISRGFLPAGVKSQLSWTTNLRQAADHLRTLSLHPLTETRETAAIILTKLKKKYPVSFSQKYRPEQSAYRAIISKLKTYYHTQQENYPNFEYICDADRSAIDLLDPRIFTDRPKYEQLPRIVGSYASFECRFLLDFGSFRDIQRHRNGYCEMPLLTWLYGFHPWYINNIPESTMISIAPRIINLRKASNKLETTEEERQNYLPLGLLVPCRIVYDLRQMIYVAELRSSKTVHSNLRSIAHHFHKAVKTEFPFIRLHCDLERNTLDVRRGMQNIKQL
ncbi:hypothetical protein P856_107 [Candidatus Endolissoclinum faulkneri L5]|uniref:Uncharacterized protein n=1 Tax=Candidatus Endolissoclinum faulkneri L5 TaxID=1401328 RepID=V9TVI8_9PROT|nr:FAD-dependent thymidylate synthase [Candidatus Endolissoclinum faulkneri]AHC73345.1 hypothetical protein P856_107 [Candidatus Endolissoclinum faulkneri L5]